MKLKGVFLILVLCFLSVGTVSAANLTVNPGGSIQSVINTASSNDTITVNDNNGSAYTYNENIVINKKLTLQAKSGGLVAIRTLDSSLPTVRVTSNGNGSVIKGFTIKGATSPSAGILVDQCSKCTISGNNISNNYIGVQFQDSKNNTVFGNNLNANDCGIYGDTSDNNLIAKNNITSGNVGIAIYNSNNNVISGNNIANNNNGGWDGCGIYLSSSSANINFNRIYGNMEDGLLNYGGIINATNNWWGSNNDPTLNSSNIYNIVGIITYAPWIVLSTNVNYEESNPIVTADLTHNSAGNDTSSQGHVPDDIPVNYFTRAHTIMATVNTRNGKANATYTSGIGTITVTVDGQSVLIPINDHTPPTVTASLAGGVYNTTKTVTLTASDDSGMDPILYYSLNNGATWNSHAKTITLNLNQGITNLKFYARDNAGNMCLNQTITYAIDLTAPTVTANLAGGAYNTTKTVILTASDNFDSNPVIYYTTNGSTPTTSSTKYVGSINIVSTTTLKFIAVDNAGNQAAIQTQNYILNLPIINVNTGKSYSTIQSAIDDSSTSDGDTINIKNGTYTENVVVNKKLIIRSVSGANVTVKSVTIASTGSGSTIQNLTLNKLALNSANDCFITGNTVNGAGISFVSANNNHISNNNISNCGIPGIYMDTSNNNTIVGNNITNNHAAGIEILYSINNLISGNNIENNGFRQYGGIYIVYSSANINFNRILGNDAYGIFNEGNGTVNATNNWWGLNMDPATNSSNIYDYGGTGKITCNPWLILNVAANPASTNNNSTITADLTHNSAGNDTSSQGHVPDGIPVDFTATSGTIINSPYTRNGKAAAVLSNLQSIGANVIVKLDNQNVSTLVIKTPARAILTINSTALDYYTNQQLNFAYEINLTSPVTWVSVVYNEAGIVGAESLKVLVNGNTVLTKYFMNYRSVPNDNIQMTLTYPGGSSTRNETIYYRNGPDAGFEIIQSFAIATNKITDNTVQSWLNRNSTYPTGATKAAYGTFMTALTTLWLSDKLADEMASQLNVTWSRTPPTVVMSGVNMYGTGYVHCQDPAMGMSVNGAVDNIKNFRFACSFLLSEVEHAAVGATGLSVSSTVAGIMSGILNGETFDMIRNGSMVTIMLNGSPDSQIIIDSDSGLVWDLTESNGFVYKGAISQVNAYCYHDQLTSRLTGQISSWINSLSGAGSNLFSVLSAGFGGVMSLVNSGSLGEMILSKAGPLGGTVMLAGSAMYVEGQFVVYIRNKEIPQEYWKNCAYHPSDCKVVAYLNPEDHTIHYIEVPVGSNGYQKWDEAVYI